VMICILLKENMKTEYLTDVIIYNLQNRLSH